ncbi:MAG: hypothetical protein M0P74_16050 [Syntrophales bacterium]|jgi:hypothetical protein|nr:hypothetical protein [Syntrophales bacterium]
MKKVFWVTILMALALVLPVSTMARVDVGISISLPPLIVFAAPPEVVVLPETNVYAVPDLDVDIFFYGGWWWRPWEGRWYRSRNYNSGWGYYRNVPSFYRGIPAGWRNDYREGRWKGHQWDHERIPHEQVQKNWRNWEKNRHWEKQNSWGVKGLNPRQNSRQQKSEVRQQKPRVQPQPRKAEPQHREVQPQSRPQTREAVKRQQSQPRNEKPEKARKDKRD